MPGIHTVYLKTIDVEVFFKTSKPTGIAIKMKTGFQIPGLNQEIKSVLSIHQVIHTAVPSTLTGTGLQVFIHFGLAWQVHFKGFPVNRKGFPALGGLGLARLRPLGRAARQLGTEVQRRSMAAATLLEPLLIVAMGAVVLLIVLAVLLPIIQLNTWVK